MTELDDDIEFDFFDEREPEAERTVERPLRRPSRPAEPQGPPRRGPAGPGRGGVAPTPLLRLIGLIALGILVIVLLVFWVNSCRDNGKQKSYENYLDKVGAVARDSQQVGRELTTVLTTPGIRASALVTRLNGLAQQQQGDVTRARGLTPPGPLRLQQQAGIEALEFRVSGLRGLADAMQRGLSAKNTTGVVNDLVAQSQRLVASDVIWDDLFRSNTVRELQAQGLGDITGKVADSNFVQFPDFASTRTWADLVDRLLGNSTTGLHGTGIVVVRALPTEKELSTDEDNTIVATRDLGFQVTIENGGDSQEVGVKITLTLQQSPTPIVKRQTIDVINAGEQKTVKFTNLGQVQFASKTTLKIDVAAVPGEENLDNNSIEFPVIFSLG